MNTLLLAGGNPRWGISSDGRGFFVFGFEVYFYAICIVCGMVAAAVLAALLMKRRNMAPDFIFTLFIFCIPSAIIGARFFSCVTDPNLGIGKFFQFRDGGLSITGGVIGGVGMGLVVCLVKKVSFLRAADCVVICILLGQAIGRLGNYFNQEVFGAVVTKPSQQWAPFAVFIDELGEWHYAFCFYEMFINLIGFALLYAAAWYWKKKPNGVFTCLYFVWYGTVRACMEPFRYEAYILDKNGVMWSEVLWILLLVGGVIGIGILLFLNYRKEGALLGSKKGDPCGITQFLSPDKKEQPYYSKINMMGENYPPRPPKEEREQVSFSVRMKEWWESVKAWFKTFFARTKSWWGRVKAWFKKLFKKESEEEHTEEGKESEAGEPEQTQTPQAEETQQPQEQEKKDE